MRLVTFRESLDLLCLAEPSQRAAFYFLGISDLVGSDTDYAAVYALLRISGGTALWPGDSARTSPCYLEAFGCTCEFLCVDSG